MNTEWGDGRNSVIAARARARIKVRVERASNGPWRKCITTKTKVCELIPNEALEAAKEAMREVTPPPGVTKTEWLAKHGDFALMAGAIAAAAPHIIRQAKDGRDD